MVDRRQCCDAAWHGAWGQRGGWSGNGSLVPFADGIAMNGAPAGILNFDYGLVPGNLRDQEAAP